MQVGQRAASLPVSFFRRDASVVARELLGAVLVVGAGGRRASGRIVEVEAYLGAEDPASHAYGFRRHRQNAALYGPPGTWYVYRSYGLHWCANLVTGPPGQGAAVLLRALEPLEGLALMRRRRGGVRERLLCAGPGRLCEALGITRTLDGARRHPTTAVVLRGEAPGAEVVASPRIGISRARDWPLRFTVPGSPWLSRRVP
ncbi:MAG: DNA-3-methyladenine glycosylase [Gemmatimonadetes bacterium]|nr:DNA-3-methyladenine glycosylase [Gemmatimonadota bacterium]MBK7784275.1 DNA-3-methyladenine glycosylase [Gemmatimonadota bacterium]